MGLFTMKKMMMSASGNGARSSTASHLADDYAEITAGIAADEFYGIPLSVDITGADSETLMYLAVFILLILVKPAIAPLREPTLSLAFWAGILAAAYAIKEVTYYPLLSTIIFTRTSYPWLIVFPHCIVATAAYRKERAINNQLHYTSSLGIAFFCYGFGGSIVSDVLMGLPATAVGHARIIPCWIAGWFLVWYSPFDVVYKLATSKESFVFYFLNACEAVDGVTTPMGRVSRSARELQNKAMAPIMAGILAGTGGAAIRYCERVWLWKGGDAAGKISRDSLEGAAWKNFWFSVIWWYIAVYKCQIGDYSDEFELHHCAEFNGNNWHRFVMVMAHVTWCFGCDLGLLSGHPLTFISRMLRNVGSELATKLHYGPTQIVMNVNGGSKKND